MLPRLRRLSAKRAFIGRGDLKHTSTKSNHYILCL